jgi:chemotaxis protein MotB
MESRNARRKDRRKILDQTDESGEGNWLISYADMMTLLCVFFVLMMILSTPDPEKFETVRRETASYFGGRYVVPHQELVGKIEEVVAERGLDDVIEVITDETGVTITFRGTVFFESGSAGIISAGKDLLVEIGQIVKAEVRNFKIEVEGHTDDDPIQSMIFPSNWELSGARASSVVRLFEQMGFDPRSLTAVGLSDTRPLKPNRDEIGESIPENKALNRRVVLKVISPG